MARENGACVLHENARVAAAFRRPGAQMQGARRTGPHFLSGHFPVYLMSAWYSCSERTTTGRSFMAAMPRTAAMAAAVVVM